MQDMRPPRVLLILSALLLALLVWGVVWFHESSSPLPSAVQIDKKENPTIGNPQAKVHLIVFEEPKCSNCKRYNNEIFPDIYKNYIETNQISYTVIPVSFLSGSMPAAVALLCVYNQEKSNPKLFFTFLDYLYQNQPDEDTNWATLTKLKEMAEEASPEINIKLLETCVEKNKYQKKIIENTEYGKKVIPGGLVTPFMFINGRPVDELSLDRIHEMMNRSLKKGDQP